MAGSGDKGLFVEQVIDAKVHAEFLLFTKIPTQLNVVIELITNVVQRIGCRIAAGKCYARLGFRTIGDLSMLQCTMF